MLEIAILAIDNCIHSTVTGPFDILSIAALNSTESDADDSKESFCRVYVVEPSAGPAQAFNNLMVTGSKSTADDTLYDIVLAPALMGNIDTTLDNRDLLDWIIKQHKAGAVICSVCASAFLLAEAGLLTGRQATTHWALAEDFRTRYPEVILKPEKMLVDEGDVITAGGVTAYLELCLYIINRFGSSELTSNISKTLLIDYSRQTQTPYSTFRYSNCHGDEEILQAQQHLLEHFKKKITVSDMAKLVGLEERTFHRRFKKATGDTPMEFIQGLRVEAAKKLLETSNEPVDIVTQKVGYENTSSFRRLFKQHTKLSPSEYRKRFSAFQQS